MVYPNEIYDAIEKINIQKLIDKNIKAVILDVDNTLIDNSKVLKDDVKKWVNELKQVGIKVCILSNTIKKRKVENIARELNLEYFMFAKKPLKNGFKKCLDLLKEKPKNICVIGDQIFTDVLGGNRMGMYTIYTHPINEKDCSITTTIKRPLEKLVIKKYYKRKERNSKCI